MDITIKGRHWKPGASFRDLAEARIQKLLRFYPDLIRAELTVTKEGYRHRAELRLHGNAVDLLTKSADADAMVAVDQVLAKQEKALARRKDRLKDRKKRGPSLRVEPAAEELPRLPSTASRRISVVRSKTRTPMLSVEQAARTLLRGNKPVLVFTERGSNSGLRVAYRIGDREVGLLELE
ncbi:MAG TPA: ribosome-associated translation inhibitor RaiA [Candidatus Eisenbacteria bacterium]